MDVFSTIKNRRSIRSYSPREIEPEKLKQVLETGRLAPSASNRQDWKFVAVQDKATRLKLAEVAGGQKFLESAPVVLVGIGTDPEKVMLCGQPAYTIDVSIALSFMLLEACELGLGTCWLGHFNEDAVKAILGIPQQMRVVAMSPLGYPLENPAPRPRKKLEDFVAMEKF